LTITAQGQEVAIVDEVVYLGSLIHSTTQSSPDISCRNAITRTAMRNLDSQICMVLSAALLGSYQDGCIHKIDALDQWCLRKLLGIK